MFVLVLEGTKLTLDSEALLAFLDVTHNLGIDVKALRKGDDLLGNLRTNINLHSVTHVEHLIHLFPVGARTFVDGTEEWGHGEHVVLDDLAVVVDEV
jgi:hypothetical protein